MAINNAQFKEKLAAEFAKIPEDELKIIQGINHIPWYELFWEDKNTENYKLICEYRKCLSFKSLKSIAKYLDMSKTKRMEFLDEILAALEIAKQNRDYETAKLRQRDEKNHRRLKEKTKQQIEELMNMYTQSNESDMLFGCKSDKSLILQRKIKEYSQDITYETSMSLLGIIAGAAIKANAEIQKDPIKRAIRAEQLASEMLPHDDERIQDHGWEYVTNITRVFERDGKTMHVCARFSCAINRGVATLWHSNKCTVKPFPLWHDINPTIIEISSKRAEITAYITENLTAVFGDGAGKNNLENFFKWYERIERWELEALELKRLYLE